MIRLTQSRVVNAFTITAVIVCFRVLLQLAVRISCIDTFYMVKLRIYASLC